jgi:hypothetical protein
MYLTGHDQFLTYPFLIPTIITLQDKIFPKQLRAIQLFKEVPSAKIDITEVQYYPQPQANSIQFKLSQPVSPRTIQIHFHIQLGPPNHGKFMSN